jgi:hypothetical protein
MPWYTFTAVWPDGVLDDARTTNLPGHDAAGRYARLIIRELKERPDYGDPQLKMIVKDADGDVIHVIPFTRPDVGGQSSFAG